MDEKGFWIALQVAVAVLWFLKKRKGACTKHPPHWFKVSRNQTTLERYYSRTRRFVAAQAKIYTGQRFLNIHRRTQLVTPLRKLLAQLRGSRHIHEAQHHMCN